MFVSLAGPFANLLVAILAAIPFRTGLLNYSTSGSQYFPSISQFLFEFIIINLALLLFNLIPIAPLDGEKVLSSVVPPRIASIMDSIRPYGPLVLLGLIMLGRVGSLDIIGFIMGPPLSAIFRLLVGV
jgi:Zn-dependent protease